MTQDKDARIAKLEAENERLKQELANEEKTHERTISERDNYHEWADKLAQAIGGDGIGHHSNRNNPWANALELAEALSRTGAVKVNPLEWTDAIYRKRPCIIAVSVAGEYLILQSSGGWRMSNDGQSGWAKFPTEHAAKAAAQADYERRILSALEPAAPEGQQQVASWPIDTDDQVEALAKECGIDNRRYMSPAGYAIWCQQQRRFARLYASSFPSEQAVTEAMVETMARWICEKELLDPDFDDGDGDGPNWQIFIDDARAALQAAMEAGR